MRDGTVLLSDVYRPKQDGSPTGHPDAPALQQGLGAAVVYGSPAYYASPVLHRRRPGRARPLRLRQGEFYPFRHEMEDGYDTVEWAAALPGSNGKVGMYGFSYVGATQWLAATQQPPHLAAIAPA